MQAAMEVAQRGWANDVHAHWRVTQALKPQCGAGNRPSAHDELNRDCSRLLEVSEEALDLVDRTTSELNAAPIDAVTPSKLPGSNLVERPLVQTDREIRLVRCAMFDLGNAATQPDSVTMIAVGKMEPDCHGDVAGLLGLEPCRKAVDEGRRRESGDQVGRAKSAFRCHATDRGRSNPFKFARAGEIPVP